MGTDAPSQEAQRRRDLDRTAEPLWRAYRADPSDAHRNRLVEHFLPLVATVADVFCLRTPRCVTRDDLYSEGCVGLMQAVESYRDDRGTRFTSFAFPRIRGSVLDYLRRCDLGGRRAREIDTKIAAVAQQMERPEGRITDKELADAVGVSMSVIHQMRDRSRRANCVMSLEWDLHEDDEPICSRLGDTRVDQPDMRIEREWFLDDVFRWLSAEERLIMRLYFIDGCTMEETGRAIGISESRVSQFIKARLARIRSIWRLRRHLAA
jgi:RNA polymerase sigma factor for flagellar operon FliA